MKDYMNKVEFMHFRPHDNSIVRGGATVAILPKENNKAVIAIAFCGPNDVFNRKVGRAVAEGRLIASMDHRANRPKMAGMTREIDITDPQSLKSCVANAIEDEMAAEGFW